MAFAEVKTSGLREVRASLEAGERLAGRAMDEALDEVVTLIATGAKRLVPRRSGRAAGSIRPGPARGGKAEVVGGAGVPYYGWLDFGGTVGIGGGSRRPYLADGRYIRATYMDRRATIDEILRDEAAALIKRAGL